MQIVVRHDNKTFDVTDLNQALGLTNNSYMRYGVERETGL